MSDQQQESMDNLLRSAMASEPVPRLSPSFDRKLKQRLNQPRLKPQARLAMMAYTVIAILVSVLVLRGVPMSPGLSFGLLFGGIAVLIPLSFAWTLNRPAPTPNS